MIYKKSEIVYNCRHINLTDWGTYACHLFNPRDKNCIVETGLCSGNVDCPYKRNLNTVDIIKNLCENQDLYRGRQALATKILEIIRERAE